MRPLGGSVLQHVPETKISVLNSLTPETSVTILLIVFFYLFITSFKNSTVQISYSKKHLQYSCEQICWVFTCKGIQSEHVLHIVDIDKLGL